MEHQNSTDWWLWRMYREVAQFVHDPSVNSEAEIMNLISAYRKHCEEHAIHARPADEHEWALNFR